MKHEIPVCVMVQYLGVTIIEVTPPSEAVHKACSLRKITATDNITVDDVHLPPCTKRLEILNVTSDLDKRLVLGPFRLDRIDEVELSEIAFSRLAPLQITFRSAGGHAVFSVVIESEEGPS